MSFRGHTDCGAAFDSGMMEAAADIARRIAAAGLEEVHAKYALGRLAHEARYSPGRSSCFSLSNLAASFRIDPSGLRRIARVTERIGQQEFAWLMSLRSPTGRALSWTHLERLATVRPSARRKDLAVATLAEELTVASLAARIGARPAFRRLG
jgi:hypothetical protein